MISISSAAPRRGTDRNPSSSSRAHRRTGILKAAALGLGLLALLPLVAHHVPGIVGLDASYVVLSGSMEPVFSPGDIIYNEAVDPAELAVGDIITFQGAEDPDRLYTHRVVGIEQTDEGRQFLTKGDANEDPDPNPVPEDRVLGRYVFDAPYYGHLSTFAQSPAGFSALIVLPALVILAVNVRTIVKVLIEMEQGDEGGDQGPGDPPRTFDVVDSRVRSPPPQGTTPAHHPHAGSAGHGERSSPRGVRT